jgi:two-component system alkaline phosphatase synthesis response regulator PhoP
MQGKKVLVVDDEKRIRELLEIRLVSEGYEVILGQNGEEGVALAKKHLPDAIIMDVMMPLMDGAEAVRCIQEDPVTKHIPVLFLTSIITKEEEKGRAFGIQIDAAKHKFMAKPFDTPILLAEIRKMIVQSQ